MSFDCKATLATVAPMIASAVGSPVAGMAVSAGLKAFGITPEAGNEEKQLAEAMKSATPADMLKLKEANNQFMLDMKKLDVDVERINAGDRSNARAREIATGDNAPGLLATVGVVGFFAVRGAIAFVAIPDNAMQPINILLGALTALLVQVGNYYFGSSASSAAKNATIHKALNK